MNRKSGTSSEFGLATAKQQPLQKQSRDSKFSHPKEYNKAPTYAQLTSKVNSQEATDYNKIDTLNSMENIQSTNLTDFKANKNRANSDVYLKGSNSSLINIVQLPDVASEPLPVPGVKFGKSVKRPITEHKAFGNKASTGTMSGGVPAQLPKINEKPIFGYSKRNSTNAVFDRNLTDGTGPVPIPSSTILSTEKPFKPLNAAFPDHNASIREANEHNNSDYKPINSQNRTHAHKSSRSQISYKNNTQDSSSNRSIPNSNNLPNLSRVLFSEVNTEPIVSNSTSHNSEYMTNSTPIPSINMPMSHSSSRDNLASAYKMPEPTADTQSFHNFNQQQGPAAQSTINNRPQQQIINTNAAIPFIPLTGTPINHNRDKINNIPGNTGSQNPIPNSEIHYSMPSANNGSTPHIIPQMPIPHGNINNNMHPNVNNMQQMQHWPFYSHGHINNTNFENQYFSNNSSNYYPQHPHGLHNQQHANFSASQQYMMPRINNNHNIPPNVAISAQNQDSMTPIPNIQGQPIGLNTPVSISKLHSRKTLNANSVEYVPRSMKSSRIKIVNPATKTELDLDAISRNGPPINTSALQTTGANEEKEKSVDHISTTTENISVLPKDTTLVAEPKSHFIVPRASKAVRIVAPSSLNQSKSESQISTSKPQKDDNQVITNDNLTIINDETIIDEPNTKNVDDINSNQQNLENIKADLDTDTAVTDEKKDVSVNLTNGNISLDNAIELTETAKPESIVTTSIDSDVKDKISCDKPQSNDILIENNADSEIKTSQKVNSQIISAIDTIPVDDKIVAETQRIMNELQEESIKGGDSTSASAKVASTEIHLLSLDEIRNLDIYPSNLKETINAINTNYYAYPSSFIFAFKDISQKSFPFSFDPNSHDEKPSGSYHDGRRSMARNRSDAGRDKNSNRPSMPSYNMEMGMFKSIPKTSEERFMMSSNHGNAGGMKNSGFSGRIPSSGGVMNRGGKIYRDQRQKNRDNNNSYYENSNDNKPQNFEPLPQTETGWKKATIVDEGQILTENANNISDEIVTRKVKGLLNKLTVDNFTKVSPSFIEWANKSQDEDDGRIIRNVLNLIFEKAVDEPPFAPMYAKLSKLIHDQVSETVVIKNSVNKDGKEFSGTMVVRRVLINRCQKEFEAGWKVEIPDDIKSDEYYAAMKIKRRGLGLVKFVGEMFLLNLISEKILRGAMEYLLSTDKEDETLESLAKLITTVGSRLDANESGSIFLTGVISRIKSLSTDKTINSRIRFMILDVLDLRASKWISKVKDIGPKAISTIHAEVEKEKAAQASNMRRGMSSSGRGYNASGMNRLGPRSGDRSSHGSYQNPRNDQSNRNAGDLSNFGNLSRSKVSTSGSLGPVSNPFEKIGQGALGWKNTGSDSRNRKNDLKSHRSTNVPFIGSQKSQRKEILTSTKSKPEKMSSVNIFSALSQDNDDYDMNQPPSPEKTSFETNKNNDNIEDSGLELVNKVENISISDQPTLNNALIQRRAKLIADEFITLRDNKEFVECLIELEANNYTQFVYEVVKYMLDSKTENVKIIAEIFDYCTNNSILTEANIIDGFSMVGDTLEDEAVDAPLAYKHFAILLAAANVNVGNILQCFGALSSSTSLSLPQLTVLKNYLETLTESQGSDTVVSLIESENKKDTLDITKFMPSDMQDADKIKNALDKKGILTYFKSYQ
ncbi:hypothetical protein BB561_001803 [Smittium simulii]|uniref:MI domain-containing protein n=1 Tax=Smittium simulii TaxID=133385 RepID=A0A2T9YT25_9FUNG|nr:hypothetical protein BB561_001803 [Smittium simulii]